MFPADNAWNQDVSRRRCTPAAPQIIAQIQADGGDNLHPDFGENPDYGIPYVVVPGEPAAGADHLHRVRRRERSGAVPDPARRTGRGRRRPAATGTCSCCRQGTCDLFELFVGDPQRFRLERRQSGARFDLTSNDLRPLGWTSADAAGLPILPGLVRYDEVAAGVIRHAIRVTFSETQRGYILPATHFGVGLDQPEPCRRWACGCG